MEMNMIRGTRLLTGKEAKQYAGVITTVRETLMDLGFEEVILPSLWDQETFVQKAGPEIVGQMWSFQDKGGRPVCLHP
jgi:histidyl-tRNA synthetase